jgi:stage V sporulation protein AB
MKIVFLVMAGASFGILSSAGVFTVLAAIGVIPRFAGKTHTADKVLWYEEMVIWGTLAGALVTVFPEKCSQLFAQFLDYLGQPQIWQVIARTVLGAYGLFSGMFVGCLALAIAEMLDSIPILARRISFRQGIGIVVLGVALGKIAGAILYFCSALYGSGF